MSVEKILVIGANGQIGCELVEALIQKYGKDHVIAADIASQSAHGVPNYEMVDVLNAPRLSAVIEQHHITQVYQLAALLSATGEKMPLKAWQLNMDGLIHILEIAKHKVAAQKPFKVFWPSSIAVFGPHSQNVNTPQFTVMDPHTMYGISKLAGERLCEYYFYKYGVDVRSLRYPGIISYKSPPGGGTTDYAIAIFHAALKNERYSCFLAANTTLPMIYMADAVRATLTMMDAPFEHIRIRSSYNLQGVSFSPEQISKEIQKHCPDFQIHYEPDFRQEIAASWPQSIRDDAAQKDWGWKPQYSLAEIVCDMLKNVRA